MAHTSRASKNPQSEKTTLWRSALAAVASCWIFWVAMAIVVAAYLCEMAIRAVAEDLVKIQTHTHIE